MLLHELQQVVFIDKEASVWPDATPSADPPPCPQTPPDTLCLCSLLFRPESALVSPCAPAHNVFTSSGKKTV